MDTPQRANPAYYAVVATLVALLIAGIGFIVLMALRPAVEPAAVQVARPALPVACAEGKRGTQCYEITVTNTGTEAAQIACRVSASGDTQATFLTGEPATTIYLAGGAAQTLTAKVIPNKGADLSAPAMICAPVPT
jgi:hypothetical protein